MKPLYFILLIYTQLAFCQFESDKRIDTLIRLGIDQILRQNYQQADSIFVHINKVDLLHPMGYLLRAALIILKSIDYEEELDKNKVQEFLNISEEKVNALPNNANNDYMKTYYFGLIKGLSAYVNLYIGDWFNAFRDGLKSIGYFENTLEQNHKSAEAKIAIGIYKYWRSRKSEIFSWLPFIKDEKQLGIRLIENGIKENSYLQYLGFHSLAWIMLDRKHPKEALEICKKMLERYPECRFFLWILARTYEDINKQKAIELYRELLSSIRSSKMNGYNEVVILHIIAQKEFELGNLKSASETLSEIRQINLTSDIARRLEDRFQKIEELNSKINSSSSK